MIVDPFDQTQGITKDGKPAAQVYFLPPGVSPNDLSDAVFVGLADLANGPETPDSYRQERNL